MKATLKRGAKAKAKPDQNLDVQVARGRLKGILNDINDDPASDVQGSSEGSRSGAGKGVKRLKKEPAPTPAPAPIIIKLFDRLVNVSMYDEKTPLYPICRNWFYDRSVEYGPETPVAEPTRNYYNGKEPLLNQLKKGRIDRVAAFPPPNDELEVQRIPFCEPPSMENGLHLFTEDYDWDNPQVTTEELTMSYLDRWVKVRQAWKQQNWHYQERYAETAEILDAIKKT